MVDLTDIESLTIHDAVFTCRMEFALVLIRSNIAMIISRTDGLKQIEIVVVIFWIPCLVLLVHTKVYHTFLSMSCVHLSTEHQSLTFRIVSWVSADMLL